MTKPGIPMVLQYKDTEKHPFADIGRKHTVGVRSFKDCKPGEPGKPREWKGKWQVGPHSSYRFKTTGLRYAYVEPRTCRDCKAPIGVKRKGLTEAQVLISAKLKHCQDRDGNVPSHAPQPRRCYGCAARMFEKERRVADVQPWRWR